MKRVSVVAVTLATAAGAAVAATATIMPAMAASGPAARPAAQPRSLTRATSFVERAQLAAGQAAVGGLSSADIAAESDGGKYLTVVHCRGVNTPPPVRVGAPGTPLTAYGTGSSAGLLKMLQKPNRYKTVYACTVNVEVKVQVKPAKPAKPTKKATATKPSCEIGTGARSAGGGAGAAGAAGAAGGGRTQKGCTKSVTLNTGFGGMASQVARHHPAG
jgi:hypothetical protein